MPLVFLFLVFFSFLGGLAVVRKNTLSILSNPLAVLEKTKTKISDYTYVVFHMPNGKFPRLTAKKYGVTEEQLAPGLIVEKIGNTYSGSSLLGLTCVLDIAKPGDKILMTSYGSGSGSDSFALTVTEKIVDAQKKARSTQDYVDRKEYLKYSAYVKHMETIH
jgi:hydroxymethylglutaryl-CoA synthase